MTNFADMGKTELRAACKEAGIAYGKLNNDGMRAALVAAQPVQRTEEQRLAARAAKEAAIREMAAKMDLTKLDINGIEGHCPCCGIDLSNGAWTYDDADPQQKKTFTNHNACLGCGGEWGPAIVRTKQVDRHSGHGVKIEKVREEKNGVKRPSAGGKCRAVWDALDAYRAETKELPTVAIAKSLAEDEGWNPANATIEFYQWRKFNGITGRSK